MDERNAKWHQMTADAVCRQLHTDAACGLSRKAARSRCKKQGINTLFDPTVGEWRYCLRLLFCDPAVLLMLFATLLTVCLTDPVQGLSVCVLLLLSGGILWRLLWRYRRLEQTVAYYRVPRVHVLRQGSLLAVSARRVVRGDVLLLRKGDIVPGDCRLLRTNGLRVTTPVLNEQGRVAYRICSKNAEAVYPYGSEIAAPGAENMLFGGSEILEGEACAVVAELGEGSYFGAIKASAKAREGTAEKKRTSSHGGVHDLLRVYGFLMLILLFLLTVIALLTQPEDRGLMDVFLPLCILCASTSPALLEFFLEWISVRGRIELSEQGITDDRAVIKSSRAADRLSDMTDLIVVGKRGLTDGVCHFHSAFVAQREITPDGEEQDRAPLTPLCEALLLREEELARALSTEELQRAEENAVLLSELCDLSAFDRAAMRVRLLQMHRQPSHDKNMTVLEVQMREQTCTLLFEDDGTRLIEQCTVTVVEERLCAILPEQRQALYQYCYRNRAKDCRTVTVARKYRDTLALVGICAVRERYAQDVSRVIDDLARCGVRTVVALNEEETANACDLRGVRVKRGENGSSLVPNGSSDPCVWIGFSQSELAAQVQAMQKAGRRVAVLGGQADDVALLRSRALIIACDPVEELSLHDEERAVEHWQADGDENSPYASQTMRRHADVILPRYNKEAGGIFAAFHAFSVARATKLRMRITLRFLLSAQLFLLTLITLCACFGVGLFNGVQMLALGLLGEMGALAAFVSLPIAQCELQRVPVLNDDFILRMLASLKTVLASVLPPTVGVVYGFVLLQLGLATQQEITAYLFVSGVIVLLLLLLREIGRASARLPWRYLITATLVTLGCVGVAVLLSCFFSNANAVFGVGDWKPLTALSLFVMPVCHLLSCFFISFFQRTTK